MENIDINSLKANPKNPRTLSKHDYESLKKSISTFGDLSGIVFNRTTQQLVGGHQRIQAFKELGGQPVIEEQLDVPNSVGTVARGYVSLGDEKYTYRVVEWVQEFETAANVAANRIQGEFDKDLLAELVYEINQLENGQDLTNLMGLEEDELSKLLDMVGANGESDPAEDEAPEVDTVNPPVSKLGEIYQLGVHRLMCGDSTDFGAVSDLMNGQTAHVLMTDPPYGIDIVQNNSVGGEKLAATGNYQPIAGDGDTNAARLSYEIVKELGIKTLIIWGGNYFTDFLEPKACWIVWNKHNTGNFADVELAWTNLDSAAKLYDCTWNGMIREGEREARVHPTQKPVKLGNDILTDFSQRGDNILDLYGGSGSALISCEKMGRICYMMELSPAYIDVIRKRYAKHIGQEENWQAATPCINQAQVAQLNDQPQTPEEAYKTE